MLAIPSFGASSNIALWRANIKPPVELVVDDLEITASIMVIYAAPVNVIKAATNAVSAVIAQPLVRIIPKRNVPNYPRLHMYVCNGCDLLNSCTLEKRFYKALAAQKEYELVRSESRSGFNLCEDELKQLDSVISPLLKNGQSIHHILTNNQDKISCCEKTAYIYADNGLFSARNIDMPRKVRFKPRKKKSVPLKVDKSCRIGRNYEDYRLYRENNPSLPVAELDSVEGIKGGSVLLTIHFVLPKLQLAFLREANDSKSVTDIFNHLYELLGFDNFTKLFPICLADNGTEFSDPFGIEVDSDGVIRSQVFYCDPSSPGQKGACENNHEFIRRIVPKSTDFGQYTLVPLLPLTLGSYSI